MILEPKMQIDGSYDIESLLDGEPSYPVGDASVTIWATRSIVRTIVWSTYKICSTLENIRRETYGRRL